MSIMSDDILALTLTQMHEHIARGELSRAELVRAAAAAISAGDDALGAFLQVDEDGAEDVARAMDEAEDAETEPLNGIPYAVKANICSRGMNASCASRMLSEYRSPYDAAVVENMRDAGGILLGVTNMDEFAMGSSTENSSVQITRNPWDLERVPGGSSGGSAAAVAARLVPAALGSDTGGSIRQPASFCGLVGMKPTYGAVSRYGLIAFASSLDQIGSLTRTVPDCAAMLDALVARDHRDTTSVSHPDAGSFRACIADAGEDLRGWQIGLPTEYLGEGVDPQVCEVVETAAGLFAELGAEVQECSLPHTEYALPAYYIIASAEASSNLARFDGIRYGLRADGETIADLYFNARGEGFGPEVKRRIMLGTFALSAGYYDAYYLKAARTRSLIAREMQDALSEFDVLLTPTAPVPAFPIGARVEDPLTMAKADICTIPANLAGIPAISVPAGSVDGLPVGIQLMGSRFSDAQLLRAAAVYERAAGWEDVAPPCPDADSTEGVCDR